MGEALLVPALAALRLVLLPPTVHGCPAHVRGGRYCGLDGGRYVIESLGFLADEDDGLKLLVAVDPRWVAGPVGPARGGHCRVAHFMAI